LASLRHPSKFERVSRLGSVIARHSSSGRQPNFARLNRGRHLCSAGRPSRWALTHILVVSDSRMVGGRQDLVCVCVKPRYMWCVGYRSSYRPPVVTAGDWHPARPVNDAGADHVDGTVSSLARWRPAVASRPTSSRRLALLLTVLAAAILSRASGAL